MIDKIELEYIKASRLVKLEGNPRKVKDKDAVKKLKKLIQAHGFQNPLQVYLEMSGEYSILCGNHRYDAGKSLGMDEFPCIVYHGDRQTALARAISDNKSSEWTEWDIPLLKDAFADMDNGAIDMEITGFSEQDIAELFDNVNFDPGTEDDQGRLDELEPRIVKCPHCGNEFDARES